MIILNPIFKLNLLKAYIEKRIDGKCPAYPTFEAWLNNRCSQYVVGTPAYYRNISTHCYYCGGKFNNDNPGTIDHFFPQSKTDRTGKYDQIFCIVCHWCNVTKANTHPNTFLRQITRAQLLGNNYLAKRFTKKEIDKMFKSVTQIGNDVLYRRPKQIYFIAKPMVLPKYFLKVA